MARCIAFVVIFGVVLLVGDCNDRTAVPELPRIADAEESPAETEVVEARIVEPFETEEADTSEPEPEPEPEPEVETVAVRVPQPGLELFYEELEPFGSWIATDLFGYVWQPTAVQNDPEWRPYTRGYWVDSDQGWAWMSDEPFGWAVYHYGRWVLLDPIGWAWIPGEEWAPAWVAWREGDDVIGWAPLPPEVDVWEEDGNSAEFAAIQDDLGPEMYCFVPITFFVATDIRPVLIRNRPRAVLYAATRNTTRIVHSRGNVVVRGPKVERIEKRAKQRVTRVVVERTKVGRDRRPGQALAAGTLIVREPNAPNGPPLVRERTIVRQQQKVREVLPASTSATPPIPEGVRKHSVTTTRAGAGVAAGPVRQARTENRRLQKTPAKVTGAARVGVESQAARRAGIQTQRQHTIVLQQQRREVELGARQRQAEAAATQQKAVQDARRAALAKQQAKSRSKSINRKKAVAEAPTQRKQEAVVRKRQRATAPRAAETRSRQSAARQRVLQH